MKSYATRFGSVGKFEKGGVEPIDDDPKHYAFSNIFEVVSMSRPWEKVAVAQNQEYVLEAIRAEGISDWRTAAHDEFALVVDGEVEIELIRLDSPIASPHQHGSIRLEGTPAGPAMGRIVARRGHMALLPAKAAYRIKATRPSAVLLQTIEGEDTIHRWNEICQTS